MPSGTPITAEALRRAREQAGLSQAELARRAGISNGFVAMIELGQRQPSMRVVHALARELDLTVGDLVAEPVG